MPSMRNGVTGGHVYSTEGGRMCPVCRQPVSACTCRAAAQPVPSGDGVVRVSRESKGRGGNAVTLVLGMRLDAAALAAVGKRLRTACGSGGTVKDGAVEVQGDHVEHVIEAGIPVRGARRQLPLGSLTIMPKDCYRAWPRTHSRGQQRSLEERVQ
jgi:translation initiation factor 1